MILLKVGWKFKTPECTQRSVNYALIFDPFIKLKNTYLGGNKFSFLNQEIDFGDEIDWNYTNNGKLWIYNINYFEFLMQENISPDTGLQLLNNYIISKDGLKDGLESFPTSLRLINWIKFLIKNNIQEEKIDVFIHKDAYRLYYHPEYHLLGNHLLENGFALYFAGVYLDDFKLYNKGKQILTEELKEQILDDGGHFELSTMYHQHMLFRVLDCYQLANQNKTIGSELQELFLNKAQKMLSWLEQMTFKNRETPLLNDSAKNIAPDSEQLFNYSSFLDIKYKLIPLSDSGYRRFHSKSFEIIADVGPIGPSYIPGHAHADTFSFVLNYNNKSILVDAGTSTYETGEKRQEERSTYSHNTVVINDRNSSEVWAGFRVGKRAKTNIRKENSSEISASHNGYTELGLTHQRSFAINNNQVIIKDTIEGNLNNLKSGKAYFHFHPDVQVNYLDGIANLSDEIKMEFLGATSILNGAYEYSEQWNNSKTALKLIVHFDTQLQTTISEL